MKGKKQKERLRMAKPFFQVGDTACGIIRSAEKQPQQNDDRYRYAEQPQQNAASHKHLLDLLSSRQRTGTIHVPVF
jgi:hypothetical protein